jgi:4-oxalocrotonate tautomerase
MPVVMVYMLPGRTEEQKKRLITAMTDAMVDIAKAPRENTAVLINEIPKTDWAVAGTTAAELYGK